MLDENVLVTALNAVQYERIAQLIYKANWSTPEVEHFLFFSVHGSPEQFLNAHFGFRNPAAQDFSFRSILKYGGEAFRLLKQDSRTDCFLRFSFHRLQPTRRWSLHISEFSAPELSRLLEVTIRERLFPAIRAVTGLRELLQVILADQEPYPG